jgi:hypothetical protein
MGENANNNGYLIFLILPGITIAPERMQVFEYYDNYKAKPRLRLSPVLYLIDKPLFIAL